MQKTPFKVATIVLLGVVLGAACSIPIHLPAITPSLPQLGGKPAVKATVAVASVQPVIASNVVSQAPVCQASNSCEALDAVQIPLDCVKKVPYTNVLVPPDTSFEVVDSSGAFICNDTGVVVNGKKVVTCHGKQLNSFELTLTNPSCGGSTLSTGQGPVPGWLRVRCRSKVLRSAVWRGCRLYDRQCVAWGMPGAEPLSQA